MLTRTKIRILSKFLDIADWATHKIAKALANIAITEITKAIEGNSSILVFEPACALDDALLDHADRDSLKTWHSRTS